jgi:MoaA/NifB/PqqE/SkfB family radical SAM enzyme
VIYSPNKIFHHQDKIEAIKAGFTPTPVHVQLVPTNRCNQSCDFCAYRQEGYSSNEQFDTRDQIDWLKLNEIVASCKNMGVKAIEITGGGEPTCHPYFLHLCESIINNGIDLGLVTNGSKWGEQHTYVLNKAKWVRFSLDAGTPATYAKIRHVQPDKLAEVRQHIRELTGPVVGVGFVVTKDNWKEIIDAVLNARQDGADNIRLSAVFTNEGRSYFHGIGDEIDDICKSVTKYSTDTFRVFNLFSDRYLDLSLGKPTYQDCHLQKFCTYIGADLNVYRCCILAYNELGKLGSIKDQTFEQMWEKVNFDFDARTCPRCMHNKKNATIDYALQTSPPHVNFL